MKQNTKIQSGEIEGTVIPLKTLGIGNGIVVCFEIYASLVHHVHPLHRT
jgi:hypothetical protein